MDTQADTSSGTWPVLIRIINANTHRPRDDDGQYTPAVEVERIRSEMLKDMFAKYGLIKLERCLNPWSGKQCRELYLATFPDFDAVYGAQKAWHAIELEANPFVAMVVMEDVEEDKKIPRLLEPGEQTNEPPARDMTQSESPYYSSNIFEEWWSTADPLPWNYHQQCIKYQKAMQKTGAWLYISHPDDYHYYTDRTTYSYETPASIEYEFFDRKEMTGNIVETIDWDATRKTGHFSFRISREPLWPSAPQTMVDLSPTTSEEDSVNNNYLKNDTPMTTPPKSPRLSPVPLPTAKDEDMDEIDPHLQYDATRVEPQIEGRAVYPYHGIDANPMDRDDETFARFVNPASIFRDMLHPPKTAPNADSISKYTNEDGGTNLGAWTKHAAAFPRSVSFHSSSIDEDELPPDDFTYDYPHFSRPTVPEDTVHCQSMHDLDTSSPTNHNVVIETKTNLAWSFLQEHDLGIHDGELYGQVALQLSKATDIGHVDSIAPEESVMHSQFGYLQNPLALSDVTDYEDDNPVGVDFQRTEMPDHPGMDPILPHEFNKAGLSNGHFNSVSAHDEDDAVDAEDSWYAALAADQTIEVEYIDRCPHVCKHHQDTDKASGEKILASAIEGEMYEAEIIHEQSPESDIATGNIHTSETVVSAPNDVQPSSHTNQPMHECVTPITAPDEKEDPEQLHNLSVSTIKMVGQPRVPAVSDTTNFWLKLLLLPIVDYFTLGLFSALIQHPTILIWVMLIIFVFNGGVEAILQTMFQGGMEEIMSSHHEQPDETRELTTTNS